MKKYLYLVLFFCPHLIFGQEELNSFYRKLTSDISFFKSLDTTQSKGYNKALDYVKMLIDSETEIDKLKLKIAFGLSGNDNGTTSKYVFNSDARLTKDFYPFNLDVQASISTQIFNGVLQENISNYHVGLDFFITRANPIEPVNESLSYLRNDLTIEGYVYADRYANQYLNINQRYEVGGGFIFNFFSGSLTKEKRAGDGGITSFDNYKDSDFVGLTPGGKTKIKAFYNKTAVKLEEKSINENPTPSSKDKKEVKLILCGKADCKDLPVNDKIKITDNSLLTKARRKISNAFKKRHSSFRLALLTGVFYEIEKGNASDSLSLANSDAVQFETREIPTTNFLRWQFRPTFEFQNDNFSIKFKHYFKMPMPWEWNSKVESQVDLTKVNEKVDYLIDSQISASYSISKKFNVVLTFRHIYDNAPKRVFIDINGEQELLSARNNNTQFNFTLEYKLL
ncbi:hypothetical protein ACOSP6_12345 [Tenacibaculum sp. MEBiC06402]|uniref:hypothetical protein n=1 Tax=unclassified Tenacibaculum TaxID=2635139 RepID=UPI003B9B8F8F